MQAHRLIELVNEHKDKDHFTFAKIIEQEERLYLGTKASELWFPWIIPLIENK